MEVNDEALNERTEAAQAADVPIEIPVEQIKQAAQQIEPIETPEDSKIIRRRGRPLGSLKKNKFNFLSKRGTSTKRTKKKSKDVLLPAVELWTPSRLSRNGRALRLKKITDYILAESKSQQKTKMRELRSLKKLRAAEAICFVSIKEEQRIVDACVKSEHEADIHPKIEEDDKSANVSVKQEHQVMDTGVERDSETNIQVDCRIATTTPCSKTKISNKTPRLWVLMEKQPIDGIDANTRNSSGPLTTGIEPKVFGHESETAIPPDTPLTAFDVLHNLILFIKSNLHHSQQHNQLQHFVRLCSSRSSDYILSIVAWHKLNCCNDHGVYGSFT